MVDNLHTQWLAQMTEMRAAILNQGLDTRHNSGGNVYGKSLSLSNDDFISNTDSDDIWDSISDYSNDDEDSILVGDSSSFDFAHDRKWLAAQCDAVSYRRNGVQADILLDQVIAILSSDSGGEIYITFTVTTKAKFQ
jgi:hypothetical protein